MPVPKGAERERSWGTNGDAENPDLMICNHPRVFTTGEFAGDDGDLLTPPAIRDHASYVTERDVPAPTKSGPPQIFASVWRGPFLSGAKYFATIHPLPESVALLVT